MAGVIDIKAKSSLPAELMSHGLMSLLRRSLRKTMVLTASVVYRQVFTHHSYGYSSSVRLLADCERLTTEEQLCANPGGHPSRY